MDTSHIPVRYGKALFKTGKELNTNEDIFEDVLFLERVLSEVPALENILQNQVIKPSAKASLLKGVFEKEISVQTMNFLQLLIKNRREDRLRGILHYYVNLYRKDQGIALVELTIPTPLDHEFKEKIIRVAKLLFKTENIELTVKENPSLIGGFILQSGDLKADASVSEHLKEMHQHLKNENIGQI